MASITDHPVRVLFIDDHPVFLDGIAAVASLEDDLVVVGKVLGIEEARAALQRTVADVIVLDLTLGGDSGFDFIRWLRDRGYDVPVLVASMHEDGVYVERALQSGATGYVTKRSASETMVEAIRKTAARRRFVDPALGTVTSNGVARDGSDLVGTLTTREFEVFQRIGQGLGTAEIAKRMHRSVKTVESHRASIKKKLGISSAPELVRYATLWEQRH